MDHNKKHSSKKQTKNEAYFTYDYTKHPPINLEEQPKSQPEEKSKKDKHHPIIYDRKNYSLTSFITCKKRPDIYFSNNKMLSGNDYIGIKKQKPSENNISNFNNNNKFISDSDLNSSDSSNNLSSNKSDSKTDIYSRLKNSNIRYFNFDSNLTVRCYNCNEVGHTNKNCPYEPQIFCYKCNSFGHEDRNCLLTKCFKCNKLGHKSNECNVSLKDMKLCNRCFNIGHSEKYCLINPEKHSVNFIKKNNLICEFCGSNEHLVCDLKKNEEDFNFEEIEIDGEKINLNESVDTDNEEEKDESEEGEIKKEKNIISGLDNKNIKFTDFCPFCAGFHKLENCEMFEKKKSNIFVFDEQRKAFVDFYMKKINNNNILNNNNKRNFISNNNNNYNNKNFHNDNYNRININNNSKKYLNEDSNSSDFEYKFDDKNYYKKFNDNNNSQNNNNKKYNNSFNNNKNKNYKYKSNKNF